MSGQQLLTVGDTCYCMEGDPSSQPVLVLIHGVGLDQGMWQPWRDQLGDRYCIVCYDLLGHGNSSNPPGPRSIEDFAAQLDQLVRQLELASWHLAGFSLGALIALSYTTQYRSGQPDSLTMLHPVFKRSPEQLQAVAERYQTTRDQGSMATVELAISRWFSDHWIATHPDQIETVRQTFRRHQGDGYLKAYYLFSIADQALSAIRFDAIKCPGLVITGGEDTGSTAAMARQLADRLQADSIVNPGHRHMAPVEHAVQLANQVDGFVRSTMGVQ